ncbi:hypothetical protein ACFS07_19650 [Undibacterium arcticum]
MSVIDNVLSVREQHRAQGEGYVLHGLAAEAYTSAEFYKLEQEKSVCQELDLCRLRA